MRPKIQDQSVSTTKGLALANLLGSRFPAANMSVTSTSIILGGSSVGLSAERVALARDYREWDDDRVRRCRTT
ncbi:hypothetical protein J6590_026184 [Homalodisca vitripennis]|nr:hypothetical protein J6590_026184 [Homalodisca vitripennis]